MNRILIFLIFVLNLIWSGCSDNTENYNQDAGLDVENNSISNDDNNTNNSNNQQIFWRYWNLDGDLQNDCREEDLSCLADIDNLGYAVEAGQLHLRLDFYTAFEDGSFELFMIPETNEIPGFTLQWNRGSFHFWQSDCTSLTKHSGCHWSEEVLPAELETRWIDEKSFTFSLPLAVMDFSQLDSLLIGAAAAPFNIETTSEFTDRYPDDIWVTSTSIRQLHKIPLDY
ncbi:MAG: hypothetical protein PF689_05415 [Deltaproteobacteria bacterium]|jgi:hypothetical protein|nr:hypothetical protein [Deltaproteobacteria bacterium]